MTRQKFKIFLNESINLCIKLETKSEIDLLFKIRKQLKPRKFYSSGNYKD